MTIDITPVVPGMGMIAFRGGNLVIANIFSESEGIAKRVIDALADEFEDPVDSTPQPETVAVDKAVWERVVAYLKKGRTACDSEARALADLVAPVDPDLIEARKFRAEASSGDAGYLGFLNDGDYDNDEDVQRYSRAIKRGRALAGRAA